MKRFLLLPLLLAGLPAPAAAADAWQIFRRPDPARPGFEDVRIRRETPAGIAFQADCQGGRTGVQLHWRAEAGDDGDDPQDSWKRVGMRLDDGPWREEIWTIAHDPTVTVAPAGTSRLLTAMAGGARRLSLRMRLADGRSVEAAFPLDGFAALLPVLSGPGACAWPPPG